MASSDGGTVRPTMRALSALMTNSNFVAWAGRILKGAKPSLTNAIIGLEQELGGALFQRKPLVSLTVLGGAVHPYLDRIAQNADHARQAAEAMADVRRSTSMPLSPSGLSCP
jgi:DNA-binding transcriptional LysR family regulator